MIRYYKLFDLLNRRGMKKTDLLQNISAPTLAKISKGKNIQTDVIDKICIALGCQPGDIMEVVEEIDIKPMGMKTIRKTTIGKEFINGIEVETGNVEEEDFIVNQKVYDAYQRKLNND